MDYFIRTFRIWKNKISRKFHVIFIKKYWKLSCWELGFGHIQMLLEQISDGAFVTANKRDFYYTNWEFPYELFANLTNQPSQKLKLKFKTQTFKDKNWKLKVLELKIKRQKSKVKT